MKSHLYDNGLPFSDKLGENIFDLRDRVFGNKASLVIIDGGIGEGKTTLAVEIADHYQGSPIDLRKQLAQGGPEFLKKLSYCYEHDLPVCIYDEAGDFNKRGSLTRFNNLMNRTFETFRAFKILVILCLPLFNVIDNDLFYKEIPRLLIHLSGRLENYGNFKAFSLYRMMYIKDKMSKLVVKSFAYELVDANFQGHFLDLPPSRAKILDSISTKGKLNVLKQSEITAAGLISYKQLSEKLGRSVIWCRKAVSDLKIKPAKLIKKAKYFNENALNRLADYLDNSDYGGSR